MAEESINIPITPEIVLPVIARMRSSEGKLIPTKGGADKQIDPRRASTGSFHNGGKKLSSGKPSPLNNGESQVPHYLLASTGSCHDFCKYGRKHEAEVKPWQIKTRKVIKSTLNQQTDSDSGDLSVNKITKAIKSKPVVSKPNSPNLSAVSGKRTSSPSNELSKLRSPPVSAIGKIMMVNEKKKNVLDKRNSSVMSGRSGSETKPDKTKETSKEVKNLVSFPVVAKPSYNGASSLKAKAKSGKTLVSQHKDQNKMGKDEFKCSTNSTVEEKTLLVIKVENTVSEAKKNQEGTKEVENKLIDIEKATDERLPFLEVDSEELVPDSKHNENTFDPPPFDSFSSPSISSPVRSPALSYVEEEVEDEFEYLDDDKEAPESKQNEKTFDSSSSGSLSSPNIPFSVESPALSYGEKESQDEIEYTNSEKEVPELKLNESTIDSFPSDSFSSPNIQSTLKSLAISYVEENAQDVVEYTNSKKKVPELKFNESTIDSSPSESFSYLNVPSLVESPALSYREEDAQSVVEYTDREKKVLNSKQNGSAFDSPPSESLSSPNFLSTVPDLFYDEEESKDELEDTNSEKNVPESKQNESTLDFIPSSNIPFPVQSPALLCGQEEDHDEGVYLDSETGDSDDSISETSEIMNSDEEETSVGIHNSKTRKAKGVSIDHDPATKLKFRRGKVLDIESNNSAPRRLKFRRAKILGENQDNASNSHRRSYEKRGVADVDGTKDDSEKVVLRHQQVEGKKDAQGLFNNVIEKTASKLAETRKSKVKALVGAFETVISLQESKSSAQTSSS